MKDKVVVVTGGARGIGQATATLAAARGARVVVLDIDQGALDETVAQINGAAVGFRCDVTDPEGVEKTVDAVIDRFGSLEVLVNNAGSIAHVEALNLSLEQWRKEIDLCLLGTFLMSQTAARRWMRKHGGNIVNIGSGASLGALPNAASYVAAKHGLIGLTKALAVDWAQYGIRVNCVCPGFTWTDLARASIKSQPKTMEERLNRIPLQKGGEPEDVAEAILYFACDAAQMVTGQVLAVDGGQAALYSGYNPPRGGLR